MRVLLIPCIVLITVTSTDESINATEETSNYVEEYLDLHEFLQRDDADTWYNFARKNDTTSCTRECVKGDNRICYYKMVLENYATLSKACRNCLEYQKDCYLPQCVTADGYEKGIVTANRRIPGPSLQVCKGDRIIVDVENNMLAKTNAMHWHGVVQKNNLYMDGVPYVTQCPHSQGTTFRYDFMADTPGTLYWHSHSAANKLNGIQGTLVVRTTKENDPVHHLYDYDKPAHVMIIMDWIHSEAESRMPGHIHHDTTLDTTYYLINGKGVYSPKKGTETTTPYHVFHVKKGMKYRFRVVSAVCTHCPARLVVERHKLLIIAADGSPVEPLLVDSLEIYSGERYDFVLHATEEVNSYWIQVRGMHHCFQKDVCQMAVLHYEGARKELPRTPKPNLDTFSFAGVVLNPQNATCGKSENGICVDDLRSLRKVDPRILADEADRNFEFTFGFHKIDGKTEFGSQLYSRYLQTTPGTMVIAWMNDIQMKKPPFPLMTQFDDIPKNLFCKNGTKGQAICSDNSRQPCLCVPLQKIRLGELVQIVLIDKSDAGGLNHPFHLHGTTFNILSMGYLPQKLMNGEDIRMLMKHKELRLSDAPPFKDTIMVPASGYAVIRFIADNPGFWFFHCHFVYHHIGGMATVFQVGERSQFPPVPKGYLKCGNYLPKIKKYT